MKDAILNSNLSFRKTTLKDINDIMILEENGFEAGNREDKSVYENRINFFSEGALIAEYDNKIVGCIFSEIWLFNENSVATNFELGHDIEKYHNSVIGTEIYISSMTIDPAYRGKGFGMQLINHCIINLSSNYPQIKSAILLVNKKWYQAHNIYVKLGFQEIGRINNFFSPVINVYEDGIIMRKKLCN